MPTDTAGIIRKHMGHPLRWLALALSCAMIAGCNTTPEQPPAPPVVAPTATALAAEPVVALAAPVEPEATANPRPLRFFSSDEMLAYMAELRTMTPAGLTAELAALGDPGNDIDRQLRVALTLINTRRPADTAKALGLLQKAEASQDVTIGRLKPLIQVLMARLLEQRRLEDQADRLAQNAREYQRKIEALNSRLEAMRAIERSLSPNPMSPSSAPRPPGS